MNRLRSLLFRIVRPEPDYVLWHEHTRQIAVLQTEASIAAREAATGADAIAARQYEEGWRCGEIGGRSMGYDEGQEAGYDEGRGVGYREGYEKGMEEGWNRGISRMREEACTRGDMFKRGYNRGIIKGQLFGHMRNRSC